MIRTEVDRKRLLHVTKHNSSILDTVTNTLNDQSRYLPASFIFVHLQTH
jgi:hypothetical protein